MLQPQLTSAQRRIYNAAIYLFAEKGSTQVTVSELADTAGVARGTIYNHVDSVQTLFEDVAVHLANEMNQRILSALRQQQDPALKLATGVRHYIRRAHEDPAWGNFISRFGFSSAALRRLGSGAPMQILMDGVQTGQYRIRADQLSAVITMIGSSVLGAIYLVREGLRTWRDAGTDCAELLLRALGVSEERARALATAELPPLPEPRIQS
ncbi:MAG: TetR family transcriptional regulator [Oceanospirillaceae bacterium]|mgnify:CR=1|uniref:TetR/AcrR family transcriptional regulator n=1 Tax=unclassified Thalassolituus TaxID=2624967 RepID=UPI000C65302F|nr:MULTISPECIES: TetR/AcrR family transcriptional regulator [unclassified Thalassolituus]MAY01070.1 TetR family transcriptional regulator [Oceanospirillaceae bacterium]MBL36566.1 TetR family transcriptional regulator [Oceanospirillaceae bacterium]MBS53366.1 TetR family transcriptional regulator [Oceanospirillaceae bacterium]|tara:strand:+ start:3635 stop:4264 length:630 start_codon:yes stop_codon:yes gene_type:complete